MKTDIFAQFRKVLYSRNEEIFDTENEVFLEMVKGVEIKAGDKYVQLDEYYKKNWRDCKVMWAMCFRRSLPLLGDNTSNRVESSFGRLKQSIGDSFTTIPDTIHGIKHLIQFADRRIEERYTVQTNRVLKIYHKNQRIRRMNSEASKNLNDRGCRHFNKVLDKFEKRRAFLDLISGGVKETFDDNVTKDYVTTDSSCNCSSFFNHQAPCIHVIFNRRLDNISDPSKSIFDKAIFHERYHRKISLIDMFTEREVNDEEDGVQEATSTNVVEHFDPEEEEIAPMTDKQKFKTILPIVMKIANLASLHGTKQFLMYKDDLETIEKKIRRGNNLFTRATSTTVDETAEQVERSGLVDEFFEESEVASESNNNVALDDTLPEIIIPETGQTDLSRFRNIRFKEAVKTRGRPKRKSRQVTFNKTAIDKKSKLKRPKQSSKKAKVGFIDDDSDENPPDEDSDENSPDEYSDENPPDEDSESEVNTGSGSDVEDSDSAGLELPSDDANEDANDYSEVEFNEVSKKPKCDHCDEEIENFSNLVQCSNIKCRKSFHTNCFDDGGCSYCG